MLADIAEAKALCEDGSEAIKAKSMAVVADARASYSNTLIKLEHMIEARLGRLRKLIDDKSGPRVDDVEGKVHYEGELVTHDGSIYQALRDTGRAPLHEEDWICIGAGGRDGRSFAVRGTYRPEEKNYRAFDIVALNGG